MTHGLEDELGRARTVKSRHGSIPSNVETLMKAASMAAFAEEVSKLSFDEAHVVEAAQKLQRPRPWKTIGQTAALVGTVAPVIDAAGKFTKGFVDAHGGAGARLAGGLKGVSSLTRGDIAAKSLTAGLGGGAIAAARDGLEVHNARKTIHKYLDQVQDKLSFELPAFLRETPEQKRKREYEEELEQRQAIIAGKAGLGVAGAAAPIWTAGHAAERLLGAQRIVHGTGPNAAEKIKREGLRPDFGGTGGSVSEGVEGYQRASAGRVHVAIPNKPLVGGDSIARSYADMGGRAEKGMKVSPLGSFIRGAVSPGEGKVLAGAMPYEQFVSQFEPDPDYEDIAPGSAFRSKSPVDPKHLGDNTAFNRAKKMFENRAPDLLGYVKRNPKRFAAGAGLAAATVAAPVAGYYAMKSLKDDVTDYKKFKTENKLSSLLSAPSGPKISTPAAPTLGVLRGSSNKSQRVGNTPIAARSGVTSSASGDAMNPRRNLGDAMRAYKT